ncbi:hypothetical protein [Streptomyces sp. URMC 123]|uniref:hypothetical protein n=1 Tax=Streptomyces sp. URMC 123 TaxID=3423403 RepID=UPI003F1C9159
MERKNRWEVRHDPYDIRLVWLRNHRTGQWITVPWRLLSTTATPFGELACGRTARDLRGQGEQVTEDAIAEAVGDLLDRAASGPDEEAASAKPARGRRSWRRGPKIAARTQATRQPAWPRPEPPPPLPVEPTSPAGTEEEAEDDDAVAEVVPLKVFDARKEARKWW